MSYATAAEVRTRLPAMDAAGDDAGTDARIASGIVWAGGICDGYLAKVATVPMATPPALVVGAANDLAAAFCVRGAFSGGGESKSPSLYDTLYGGAIKLLEQIAAGTLLLPVETTAEVDTLPNAETTIAYHSAYGQRSTIQDASW